MGYQVRKFFRLSLSDGRAACALRRRLLSEKTESEEVLNVGAPEETLNGKTPEVFVPISDDHGDPRKAYFREGSGPRLITCKYKFVVAE